MKVYFTSPTLGQIFGMVTTDNHQTYYFTGANALINIELTKSVDGNWICLKDAWLLDSQVNEIGAQIDQMNAWLSVR